MANSGGNADERITGKDSFDKFTKDPHQIAGLYFYMTLDCLVDLAHKISRDFFKRPHRYTKHDLHLSKLLAKLYAGYGANEKLLSKEQRFLIFESIFGQSANTTNDSDFPKLRDQLLHACAAFAERAVDDGVEMLKANVRTTHWPFKNYLNGLQGASVESSRNELLPNITENTAYQILRNKEVSAVFGISDQPKDSWPYVQDCNGDKLVDEVTKQLMSDDASKTYLTKGYFSNLQRVALRGTEAIEAIIDFGENKSDDDDLKRLITRCYTWGSALNDIRKPQVSSKA